MVKQELDQPTVDSILTVERIVILDIEELIKELLVVELEVVYRTCRILDQEVEDLPIMDSKGQEFLLQEIILIKMI